MSRGAPKAPITYAGEYDEDKTYLPLVIVTHDGMAYLSVATSTGTTPTSTALTPWFPLGNGGGSVLYVSNIADGPPPNGEPFWLKLDGTC